MYLHLTNSNGELLCSNLPSACMSCLAMRGKQIETVVCAQTMKPRRRAWKCTELGTVYFCGDDAALLKSRRLVRERLRFYVESLKELEEIRAMAAQQAAIHLKRLMHNLLTQNAHNIQEVYSVVSQEVLGLAMSQQIETVKHTIEADPVSAARAILRINKNNVAMKCEFAAFNFLHDPNPPQLKRKTHKIHKVVMNALHPFFQDFKEKNVHVAAEESDASVTFDYETMQVVLHHLISNAVKYTLPNTQLLVSFPIVDDRQAVLFDMISLEITNEDLNRLEEEGFSGKWPSQLQLAGEGLGMSIVSKLLKLNGAELTIHRNVDESLRQTPILGVYENNHFVIVLGRPH